ncbi:putative ABC transporter ATP-binding protein [Klebsiella pneumoniae]|uniref:ATP-binding cassette domain-containing protein n=1 Tax=Klebsiella pneumoniae TaxID=573 RepID=UPI000808ED32|nr:ATP-binding cassette domain-containing protein [Klebsiella pneumoniae]SBZ23989.1 putative ABC transporter ATP-binding protein [Klebsiella pneumoniae]
MSTYTINVSFQTRVNKTTRTLEIAESFGLGLDEKDWTLYDNLELEVEQGDVVYITGQSGSGKSVVLRELQRQMKDEGLSVASIDDFTFDNDVNVIDQLGKTTSEALGLLSMAGLNDAYLFVRKPSEMSDGQKYRLKIAKLIELMINNDGSVLDCWHNGGRPYVMVGAMESLRLDFINANIERR